MPKSHTTWVTFKSAVYAVLTLMVIVPVVVIIVYLTPLLLMSIVGVGIFFVYKLALEDDSDYPKD